MLIYLQMIENPEDRSKFEILYDTYCGLMFYVARHILGSDQDAEDAVHEAFIKVAKNISKIFEPVCPKTRTYLILAVERRKMMKSMKKRLVPKSKKLLAAALLCGLMFLLSGCAPQDAYRPAEPEQASAGPVYDETESVTYEAFRRQLEQLAAMDCAPGDITYDWLKEQTPDLAAMMENEYETVAEYCFSDLVDPEAYAIRSDSFLLEEEPSRLTELECAVVRCLSDAYDQDDAMEGLTAPDPVEWFSLYTFYSFHRFIQVDYDFNAPYYDGNPIWRQNILAILREPLWRIPAVTPVTSELYDEMAYIDAVGCFVILFDQGEMDARLSVSPSGADLAALCSEYAQWSISQSENLDVTLRIVCDEEEVVITYTPEQAP